MPGVAIRSTTQPVTRIRWLKPAPLWGAADADMTRPYIAEFKTDNFLSDFLAMMKGNMPLNLTPPQDKDAAGRWKLYQPLFQRYYLVTGSLVCFQGAMSDVGKNGEKTSFVLRRMVNGQEQGWIKQGPNKGWQPLVDEEKRPVTLLADEERLPLYSVPTSLPTQKNQTPAEPHRVYYGNIPANRREKYLDLQQTGTDGKRAGPGPAPAESYFVRLVYEHAPCAAVVSDASEPFTFAGQPVTRIEWLKPAPLWGAADADMSRPYIAEFKTDDFLSDFLAMMKGNMPLNLTPPQDKDAAGRWKLYQPLLQRYYLVTGSLVCFQDGMSDQTVVRNNGERISFVLRRMVNGQEQGWIKQGPNKGWQPLVDEEKRRVTLLADEERLPLYFVPTSLPTQKNKTSAEPHRVYYGNIPANRREKYLDLQQTGTDGKGASPGPAPAESYFVRLVYEHAPYAAVVSDASEPFTFARYFDPDAPKRQIRIETPNGYIWKTFPSA
jgi:hypothetical protein